MDTAVSRGPCQQGRNKRETNHVARYLGRGDLRGSHAAAGLVRHAPREDAGGLSRGRPQPRARPVHGHHGRHGDRRRQHRGHGAPGLCVRHLRILAVRGAGRGPAGAQPVPGQAPAQAAHLHRDSGAGAALQRPHQTGQRPGDAGLLADAGGHVGDRHRHRDAGAFRPAAVDLHPGGRGRRGHLLGRGRHVVADADGHRAVRDQGPRA